MVKTDKRREGKDQNRYLMVLQHILPFACLALWCSVPLAFSSCFGDLPAWFYLWVLGLPHPSFETSVWLGLQLSGFSWASPLLLYPMKSISQPGLASHSQLNGGLWFRYWLKKPGASRRFAKQSLADFSISPLHSFLAELEFPLHNPQDASERQKSRVR